MSKEYVRLLITKRLKAFDKVLDSNKAYPNAAKPKVPKDKMWLELDGINFVKSGVASIGSDPCIRRTGVIVIDVFEHIGKGVCNITVLTDQIETYFQNKTDLLGSFWTGVANTIDNKDEDSKIYRKFTVYIPFTYDPTAINYTTTPTGEMI